MTRAADEANLGAAMRELVAAVRSQSAVLEKLLAATKEAATEQRLLRNELRAGREKQIKTRRVKAMRNAQRLADVPVSDIAAVSARRALAKLGL